MKRRALMTAAAVSVLVSASALAQQVAVEIAPDTRTTIREYVVKEKIKPVTVEQRMVVGATVPTEIEMRPAPEVWGPSVSKYHYVYSDNHVVLVEPSSRKVVQIID
ncbi:MAG TPA: DUF1236 domain-containing protein [Reyranellaceae bacterium]|nr:DUF1236 domain-containing protein [Reyranellaceae bacterium]